MNRYSGWPAYIVDHTTAAIHHQHFAEKNRSGASSVLLVSSLTNDLDKIMNRADDVLKRSLFYATFSLTESPMDARLKIEGTILGFGVIYLRMMRIYEKHDNLEYAKRLGQLLTTAPHDYVVCLIAGGRDTLSFIAYRTDIAHMLSSDQPCLQKERTDHKLMLAD